MKATMTQAQAITSEKLNKVVAMMRIKDFKISRSTLKINWCGWTFKVTKDFRLFYEMPTDLSKATLSEASDFAAELAKAVAVAKDAETFAEDGIMAGADVLVVMPDKSKVAGKVAEVWDTANGNLYKVATEAGIMDATNDNIILK